MGRRSREKQERREARRIHFHFAGQDGRLSLGGTAARFLGVIDVQVLQRAVEVIADTLWYPNHRIQERYRLQCAYFTEPCDPVPLFDHLGETVLIRRGNDLFRVGLPSAEAAIRHFEAERLILLGTLRDHLQNPEQIRGYIEGLDQQQQRMYGEDRDARIQDFIATVSVAIGVIDLLTMYLRHRYGILPSEPLGWYTGRRLEAELLIQKAPDPSRWSADAHRVLGRFAVAIAERGGFALPEPRGSRGPRGRRSPGEGGSSIRIDPERLAFYLSLPEFVELRALAGDPRDNPNDYILVVFTEDRYGLDTIRVGNRFFGLEGPFAECLAVAQRKKREIENHPLCPLALIHDPPGEWKLDVRRWLRRECSARA